MFHTEDGEFPVYGTLKKAEDMIRANAGGGLFVKCNSCYFVNLRFVTAVRDSFVIVGDEQLIISRAKRKDFITQLNKYFGMGGACV